MEHIDDLEYEASDTKLFWIFSKNQYEKIRSELEKRSQGSRRAIDSVSNTLFNHKYIFSVKDVDIKLHVGRFHATDNGGKWVIDGVNPNKLRAINTVEIHQEINTNE